jgi:ribosomal protein S5
VKTLVIVFVLVTAGTGSHAYAQGNPQSRAYRKAARKAQKNMIKYNKHQQKAMQKSAKAQQKALKRAQRGSHY